MTTPEPGGGAPREKAVNKVSALLAEAGVYPLSPENRVPFAMDLVDAVLSATPARRPAPEPSEATTDVLRVLQEQWTESVARHRPINSIRAVVTQECLDGLRAALRVPAGEPSDTERLDAAQPELEADAYPVVAEVVNAAQRAYDAWREWMDAEDAFTNRSKAMAHGHEMQALCDALAECYKVIPLPGDAVIAQREGSQP